MIHLWRNPQTGVYGLKQFQLRDGSFNHVIEIGNEIKPPQIDDLGTLVTLLGRSDEENTMLPPPGTANPSHWIAKHLNTRYFRFPEWVRIEAREGWDQPAQDKTNNRLRRIIGQEKYLDSHAESSGKVELEAADALWWILKESDSL